MEQTIENTDHDQNLTPVKLDNKNRVYATGKRKNSIAFTLLLVKNDLR